MGYDGCCLGFYVLNVSYKCLDLLSLGLDTGGSLVDLGETSKSGVGKLGTSLADDALDSESSVPAKRKEKKKRVRKEFFFFFF